MSGLELAVVIPTFNEAGNVEELVERLERALAGFGWEAIFVDDNSPDGTAERLRSLAQRDRRIRVIERIRRRGLSSACIEGMMATAAPLIAVMDADLQHDPEVLPRLAAALRADPELDLAIASRFVEGGGTGDWERERVAKSETASRIAQLVLKADLRDPMSGCFMIRGSTFRQLAPRLSGIGFKILLDLLTSATVPLRFAEVPLQFHRREVGESKLDHVVAMEFLIALYDRMFGRIVPTRFAMFALIGGLGVAVHMAILALAYGVVATTFLTAQIVATIGAMTFNFFLNNGLTYRDRRLHGARALTLGWLSFCAVCSVGALANVGVAAFLFSSRYAYATVSALAGILVGAVWNFALSSRFTWGRY
ncbi:glycosyltransferase family 2 protein [Sphingomonas sp. ID1715]|uniref:glycosyltransferase n=1 Tax=Sphingomonas sp. ID1715 TaxID=1656898 RepID=UPI00148876EB|nr:glycosyltransferase family 2 protein [Sphingomonas sp. ID1715]NNM77916.1 glycosyltransferase family 2 protein [Sphingomonas sp. ID1715]